MTREITKLDSKASFDEFLKNAGDALVVVDFFAEWCGPCKMIAPKVKKFANDYTDVYFAKVDVDENDETAEAEGVSAMPTFKFYKNGKKVDELTGANEKKLEELIKKHK